VSSRAVLVLVLVLAIAGNSRSQPADDEESSGSAAALTAPKEVKARDGWLRDHLNAAITARPALAKAKLTAYVVDVDTGSELFSRSPDQGMNLASNAKLLTSGAALATLGGGFRWRTTVYADSLDDKTGVVKGNLYVRGRGDPTLSAADLGALAQEIAAHGVRTVEGQLVVDDAYFDRDVDPPHYSDQPNERAGFRAPIASFDVARSSVTVIVIPEPGGKATVRLDPDAGDYLRITKAEVETNSDKPTKIKIDVKPGKDQLEIEVSGQIRPADGSYDARKRIDDPSRFAAEVFRKALAAHGVKIVKHAFGAATVPPAAKLLATHDSEPLSAAIRDMNKHSDNYIAEAVLKTLGAEARTTPGGTWADGVAAVRAALLHVGVTGTYRLENGSGLYGASEVSARQLVGLLRAAHGDFRIGPDLLASLPVGGEDGTLAKRWHGHDARGRVRAKTGTLDKVITLAGYVGVDGRHLLAFAILANDVPPGQRATTRALADDMVDAMVAYLEAAR
jgi:D-alanyl-D-alanine carboxypeptidase/D-alanyl-D-alanine-endopeptidase (penicillin-binding protein 4)